MPKPELFNIKVEERPIEELVVSEDLPEDVERKMLNDIKFLQEHGIKPDDYPGIDLMRPEHKPIKVSYTNYDSNIHREKPADTRKWLDAARQIFYLAHNGEDRGKALQKVIARWSPMEQKEFYYWLRYYEAGNQLKYKAGEQMPTKIITAQMPQFLNNTNQLGYPMPMKQPSFEEVMNPQTHPDMLEDECREKIEAIRTKVISRLDSVEKLLRSDDCHTLVGKELEAFLDSIYQLKKKIYTVNKRSLSTRLYEDMIVREANILTKNGFIKSADLLHSVAQAMPAAPEANNPLQMGGVPGNLPGAGPGMTPLSDNASNDPAAPSDPTGQTSPTTPVGSPTALPMDPPAAGMTQSSPTDGQAEGQGSTPIPTQPSVGMSQFLKGLEEGGEAMKDEVDEIESKDEVSTASIILGLKLQAALVLDRYYGMMIATAQTAPIISEEPPAPEPTVVNEDPISEPTPKTDPEAKAGTDFDKIIDSAFQQLTIADVVSKLEDLTKVFKVREIPRQLGIVDMMLDRLGLATFFPSLGECVQKSHESNNYVASRLEDILSRLRGTMPSNDVDLKGDMAPDTSPEAQALQAKLRQEQEIEANRKRQRKDQANKELDQAAKPKADIEVAEDLGAQAPQMAPAPAPVPAPAAV